MTEPGKDFAGMERLKCAKCGLEITPNDKVKIISMEEVVTKDTDLLVAHDICPNLTPT